MSGKFAEHDDGGFGGATWRLGIRVVGDVEFTILVLLERTGTLLSGTAPCRFDLDKFRPRGNLPVDVRSDFELKTGRVKALCGIWANCKSFRWHLADAV
jgi:hypothetical protein